MESVQPAGPVDAGRLVAAAVEVGGPAGWMAAVELDVGVTGHLAVCWANDMAGFVGFRYAAPATPGAQW